MAAVRNVRDTEAVLRAVTERPDRGVIARGLGRAYGDPAQNAGGVVLDMTSMSRILAVDADARVAHVEAGVSLATLMRVLIDFGLWVPVLPGTAQVTVGGAIAADVHGKNHHVAGSFGNHVRSLDLLTADGSVRTVRPDDPSNQHLFWATVGGMGLTGVILRATLVLQSAETAFFVVDTERARNLDDLLERLAEGDADYPYSVAWFDAMAGGDRLGRAVITRGRAATLDDMPPDSLDRASTIAGRPLVRVPSGMPPRLLNGWTGRAFNEYWFRKAPVSRRGELQSVTQFFHPLDVVRDWNQLYGRHGFCQYQFVVPLGAETVLRECTRVIAESGHVSALNVLKRFGPANPAPLSFPCEGWTLAVDIPVRPGLQRLLGELDAMVLAAGGRVYLAKDSRLRPTAMDRMYPRLPDFRRARREVDPDGVFRSDLSRRLDL